MFTGMFNWFRPQPPVPLKLGYVILRAVSYTIAVPLLAILLLQLTGVVGEFMISVMLLGATPLICFITAAFFEVWRIHFFRRLTIGDVMLIGSLALLLITHVSAVFLVTAVLSGAFVGATLLGLGIALRVEQRQVLKAKIVNTLFAYAIVAPLIFILLGATAVNLFAP